MVQLSAPATDGPKPPPQPPIALGRNPVDSGAVTEDSIADLNLADTEPAGSPRGFTGDESAPPVVAPAESPSWQSDSSARSKQVALMVVIGIGSLVSVAILVSVLMRGGKPDQVAQNDGGDSVETPSDETSPQSETAPKIDPDPGPADSPADSSALDPADADPGSDTESEPGNEDPAVGDATTVTSPATTEPLPTDPLPMDLLPKNPLLPENPLGPAKPPEDGDGMPEDPTLRGLKGDLADLFETFTPGREQRAPNQPPPPTIEQVILEKAADANVDPDVALKPSESINMRQALGSKLWLKTSKDDGYPLNDLLLFLSHFTGAPVDVEWVSFDIVGQPINQPVKVPSRLMSVEEVLKVVCDSINAEFEAQEDMIVVRPNTELFEAAVSDVLRFDDLGDQADSAAALARTMLRMEPIQSSEVQVPEDLGQKQLAVLVCETIRQARGVETKMPADALARWAGEYKQQLAGWQPIRQGVSGPTLVQPTSFGSLIRSTARRNSVTCFVRWRDAAMGRLTPVEEQMPFTGDEVTAEELLSTVLSSYGLIARSVDKDHWWVGSQASFDRFPVVVWFDEKGDSAKRLERIRTILATAGDQTPAADLDPVSGACVAILPRYLLRQVPRVFGDELAAGE